MRFFPHFQFERPLIYRLPTHPNTNVVRIAKIAQNNGPSLNQLNLVALKFSFWSIFGDSRRFSTLYQHMIFFLLNTKLSCALNSIDLQYFVSAQSIRAYIHHNHAWWSKFLSLQITKWSKVLNLPVLLVWWAHMRHFVSVRLSIHLAFLWQKFRLGYSYPEKYN